MGDKTAIQWTDATWNPIRGCSIVSAGCENCYAMKTAARFGGKGMPYEGLTRKTSRGPVWTGKVKLVMHAIDQPLRWQKPRMVFVNSMSDLFHEEVTDETLDELFTVMSAARQHTFQVLTKRAARMREYCERRAKVSPVAPNIWLGVSTENQHTLDDRWQHLKETPAAVRFLSCEPLLGPLRLRETCCTEWVDCERCEGTGSVAPYDGSSGGAPCSCECEWGGSGSRPSVELGVDWVIVGGESGPRARKCHIGWIRGVVEECAAANVPCFVKQLGVGHGTKHSKGGDPDEWPEDLRVREMPNG